MKQQILVIHGGDAFATYDEYIAYLNARAIDLHKNESWKRKLTERLGEGYDVILSSMPNSLNAKYLEWKIVFEKYLALCDDNLILLGHSLGGVFLAKYLSEEKIQKTVRATLFIAAPYEEDGGRKLAEFAITSSLDGVAAQGGKLFFYHSKDDPVVAFSELAKFQHELPNATYRIFEDRQHFNQEEFPEIVEDIKTL